MAFRGEVHHHVGMFFLKQLINAFSVADIQLHEAEVGVIHDRRQRGQVAGVGQLVQADNAVIRVLAQHMKHKVGTDKSGTAGYNNCHTSFLTQIFFLLF